MDPIAQQIWQQYLAQQQGMAPQQNALSGTQGGATMPGAPGIGPARSAAATYGFNLNKQMENAVNAIQSAGPGSTPGPDYQAWLDHGRKMGWTNQ